MTDRPKKPAPDAVRGGLLRIALVLAVICAGLLALDFAGGKPGASLDKASGFHAAFGFGVFALIVLAGWPLGWLLRRRPDYYEDAARRTRGDADD